MIVVVVIGILSAIAIPAYQQHIMRTYRDSAKACLTQHAQFMERFYSTNLTYVAAAPNLGCSTESNMDSRYTIALSNVARATYTVTAFFSTQTLTQIRQIAIRPPTLARYGQSSHLSECAVMLHFPGIQSEAHVQE